jgi:hypothetical protein
MSLGTVSVVVVKGLVKTLPGLRWAAVLPGSIQKIATVNIAIKKNFELNSCSCLIRLGQM